MFDWHGDQRHPRRLAAADFLIGKIDAAAYEKTNPPSGSFFIDRYGMRGFTDGSKPIDWLARDSSGDLSVDYANGYVSFSFAIPFATRYWEQGDPAYLRKFFRIGGDSSRHCPPKSAKRSRAVGQPGPRMRFRRATASSP